METRDPSWTYVCVSVPLTKPEKDFIDDVDSPNVKTIRFTNQDKFKKYIYADFVYEIQQKCNADFFDEYESEVLYPDMLPAAIEIVSKAVEQKKNSYFKDYLVQTKEMMELALSLGTFVQFNF